MNTIKKLDKRIIYWIQSHRNGVLDTFFAGCTYLGDNGFAWMIIAIVFILSGRGYIGEAMIAALAFSTIFCLLFVKKLAKRKRPCDHDTTQHMRITRPGGNSFPSSHSSAAFAAAGVIWLLAPQLAPWALLLAALIAFSRVYLFVHYPSDVIAGVIVGMAFASLGVTVVQRLMFLP